MGDQIYVATEAGTLVALDRDGKTVWEKTVGGKIYTTPVLSGDLILVAPYQAEFVLAAYDADGKQAWTFTPAEIRKLTHVWDTIIIQPMTNLLLLIYDLLGHGPHMFGLAIILFTILIKVITWPLNASQVKGAQAMQELQNDKEWQDIQKKYAKDKEKIAQEQMRIYKERGINPFASCLPTLIQFPIIIGLYQSITRALSVTPFDMLKLARTIYPFQNVESIIPLNSKFLWMDLGQPESIPDFWALHCRPLRSLWRLPLMFNPN